MDDYDSNEFDDSSSEDERRKVLVKKPPLKRVVGEAGRSKNKKTKLTSRQKWQMEDALDTRPKLRSIWVGA